MLRNGQSRQIWSRIKRALQFRPDDPQNMIQVLPQKEVGEDVDRIEGFRYPAPGSRAVGSVPTRESDDAIYDVKFYPRDGRNAPTGEQIYYNSKNKPTLIEPKISHDSSPGNKNPAVLAYDPSGLRSSMTATWSELDKAIKENAIPDHLPQPVWYKTKVAIDDDRVAKGLPFAVGQRCAMKLPPSYNDLKW